MGIDPINKAENSSIDEHVRAKKETEDTRDGAEYEHYGYRKIWRWTPPAETKNEIHQTVKETWGGELPTVLDATAGGGSIPFESVRYGFPTVANELNPVASVILKSVLEHPRVGGDLSDDIESWGQKVNQLARETLSEYYPTNPGEKNLAYLWAHTAICPDCGLELPLTPNWWLDKESASEGVAVRPKINDEQESVEFSIIKLPAQVQKSEFNPTDGTVSYGKATCLRCDVTIDSDELKSQAQNDEYGYMLYGVYFENQSGNREFRSPRKEDRESYRRAVEKTNNDVDIATFLSEEVPSGEKTDELRRNGITEWRDTFSPRQFLTHYAYFDAYQEVKEQIISDYDEPVAEAILTFLSLAADKALDYNNRMSAWDPTIPKIAHSFERHNFAFKWSFAENNLIAEGLGYDWVIGNVLKAYNDLHDLSGDSSASVDVYQSDARSLPVNDQNVDAVVLDPPYYDNVMYAELSDFFYVWQKEYLGDILPEFFQSRLTDKDSEAVANPSRYDEVSGGSVSTQELANQDYEDKMTSIFSEMYRVLQDEGIFTLMFTHKKTEAWDTLTTALIESGFVVTATHPISTENPNSLHQMGKNAAESTILLASEKREKTPDQHTLWSEIQTKTREVAEDRARQLDEGDVDFAKVDIILASFGPTLEVFTKNYPVVNDEGDEVQPQTALDEARTAVRDYFIDKYLNEGVRNVDPKTEWYVISWLVFEAQRFPYDEARRLAIGFGEDLDSLKRTHRMWRKKSGDVLLRPHGDRVQDVNKEPSNRSGRKPVDPDALSFATALDKVHAAMHVYDAKGATEAWNWMNDRNCGSDPSFRATLEALLRVLPQDHSDWELARDIAVGETGELLDLELDADIFEDDDDEDDYQGNLNDF
jgi:adenine-specific DNA methylase